MRYIFLLFVFIIFIYAEKAHTAEPPSRVVSINLCSDQLLLMLARPEQIASVSRLSREPNSSFMANSAARYPVNDGKIEQLLAQDPDLILASEFSPRRLLSLLRQLGYRIESFPQSTNIDAIRSNIRRMAELLGARQRGEEIISKMDHRLHRAAAGQPHQRPKAIFYQPRGYTSGSHTLQDQALTLAGWRNLAAELGIAGYGSVDLERLLRAGPDQFFTSAYAPDTDSLAQRRLAHPALRVVTRGKPIINIDYRFWICGGPMIADAVEALTMAHPEHQ